MCLPPPGNQEKITKKFTEVEAEVIEEVAEAYIVKGAKVEEEEEIAEKEVK